MARYIGVYRRTAVYRAILRRDAGRLSLNGDGKMGLKRGIDLFYWAMVALVAAATSGVLTYAAGTPAFLRAASVVCWSFSALAIGLCVGGLLGWLADSKWGDRQGAAPASAENLDAADAARTGSFLSSAPGAGQGRTLPLRSMLDCALDERPLAVEQAALD